MKRELIRQPMTNIILFSLSDTFFILYKTVISFSLLVHVREKNRKKFFYYRTVLKLCKSAEIEYSFFLWLPK